MIAIVRWMPLAAVIAAFPALSHAQGVGAYLNYETPLHHSIATVKVGTTPYLLVCNAADNAVEMYSIAAPNGLSPVFLARIPVGLEPVTVAVRPTAGSEGQKTCYVANWLGDSITKFDIAVGGAVTLGSTVHVGDEPTGIAFHPSDESVIVTFSAPSTWGWFDPDTLAPVQPGWDALPLVDADEEVAIRDPRAIGFSPSTAQSPNLADLMVVLNHRGGNNFAAYDYDLWVTDDPATSASTGLSSAKRIPATAPSSWQTQVGTTNFDMAFAPSGDLWIASQTARNRESTTTTEEFVLVEGETVANGLVTGSTGFVRSQLVRVRGAGTGSETIEVLDLNDGGSGTQASLAVTQPTSLLVVYDEDNEADRIFVTGFASDSLAVIEPTSSGPSTWTVIRVDLRPSSNAFGDQNQTGVMRGPRAMALNPAGTRIYVHNRLTNDVTVVSASLRASNPQAGVLAQFSLQHDPTPAYITTGRKFLYSSRLSGGNNVSCASCHIDGNSDYLAWNLSADDPVPASSGPAYDQGGDPGDHLGPNTMANGDASVLHFKGPMQTQSLRGLVNFEVLSDAVQDAMFSNKPYHWRGDRATFQDFNGAFISLMAIANAHSGTEGIAPARMDEYREFVNSIHYPPNPAQPLERGYSGAMVDSSSPAPGGYSDFDAGSGGQRGLKNFMSRDLVSGDPIRTCVHCHSLPEGSNNRITDTTGYDGVSDLSSQRIETAALRSLLAKERLSKVSTINGTPTLRTSEFGLIHTGESSLTVSGSEADTIAAFVGGFNMPTDIKSDVSQFLRELDSGSAPVVGRSMTVDSSNASSAGSTLDVFESQVLMANAELAVIARIGSQMRGFWFDARDASGVPYVEVPQSGVTPLSPMNRASLLAQATGANQLVFQCTPLGSGRRVAYLSGGIPTVLGTSAPTGITLRGCRPMIANVDVPHLTANWATAFRNDFDSRIDLNVGHNLTKIWLQASLLSQATSATPASFGLSEYRHEPPRRFVVAGTGIAPGAWVRIFSPNSGDFGASTPTSTPTTSTHPNPIELPIFAAVDSSTGLEWQTAAEIDAYELLCLMHGGAASTEVQTARDDPESLNFLNPTQLPALYINTDYFLPLERNWVYVQVINDPANPSTTTSAGVWQRITLH